MLSQAFFLTTIFLAEAWDDTFMSKIQIFKDADVLADNAAQMFVDLASQAISDHGSFSVALSGGSTPKKLHKLLAETYKDDVDWSKVFVFLNQIFQF